MSSSRGGGVRRGGGAARAPSTDSEDRVAGMVVHLTEAFGFLRVPSSAPPGNSHSSSKKEEGIFFRVDDVRSRSCPVPLAPGDEFSFTIRTFANNNNANSNSSTTKRTQAVNLEPIGRNESFAAIADSLPLRLGQVVAVDDDDDNSSSGYVELLGGGGGGRGGGGGGRYGASSPERARFEAVAKLPVVQVGQYCTVRVCAHPLQRQLVCVGDLTVYPTATSSSAAMGRVTQLLGDGAGKLVMLGGGAEEEHEVDFVSSVQSGVRVGDQVQVLRHGDGQQQQEEEVVVVTALCVPQGEQLLVSSSKEETQPAAAVDADRQLLLSWLDKRDGKSSSSSAKEEEEEEAHAATDEEDSQRVRGRVVSVKEKQFAFAELLLQAAEGSSSLKEQIYIHWSELCAPPSASSSSSCPRVGDVLSFEVRQKREGRNVAARAFNLTQFGLAPPTPASASAGKRGSSSSSSAMNRACFVRNVTGQIELENASSGKQQRVWVNVDTAAALSEDDKHVWERLIAMTTTRLQVESGDAKQQYTQGQTVSVDIVVVCKSSSAALRVLAAVHKPRLRSVVASNKMSEEEVGVVAQISSQHGVGSIVSSSRADKIGFDVAKSGGDVQPGEWVAFVVQQPPPSSSTLQATRVRRYSVDDGEAKRMSLLGLRPLSLERVRGVCTRHAGNASSGDAAALRSSWSNGPGRILVVPSSSSNEVARACGEALLACAHQADEAAEEVDEEEENGHGDWRKLAQLQRSVEPACAEHNHVFALASQAEVAAVEKECKRLGLGCVKPPGKSKSSKSRVLACGRDQALLDLWAARMTQFSSSTSGGKVRIASRKCGGTVLLGGGGGGQFVDNNKLVWDVKLDDDDATVVEAEDADLVLVVEEEHKEEAAVQAAGGADKDAAVLREWLTYAPSSSSSSAMKDDWKADDENTLRLPVVTVAAVQACVEECVHFTLAQTELVVSCDAQSPPAGLAQYGFFFSSSSSGEAEEDGSCFPIEGEEVDFVPCVSVVTGRLRAWDVKLVQQQSSRSQHRVEGVVEEVRSGGWVRPTGGRLPAVKFEAGDVIKASSQQQQLAVGDVVDFVLVGSGSSKARARRIRLVRRAPPRSSSSSPVPPPPRPSSTPTPPPSRFANRQQATAATGPSTPAAAAATADPMTKIAMPSNYLTAPGPDEDYAVGFTPEKWRFLRQVVPTPTKIRATAAEFVPQGFQQ